MNNKKIQMHAKIQGIQQVEKMKTLLERHIILLIVKHQNQINKVT